MLSLGSLSCFVNKGYVNFKGLKIYILAALLSSEVLINIQIITWMVPF